MAPAPPTLDGAAVRFTIDGPAMGYVRRNRADAWKPSARVLRYYDWCETVRQASRTAGRWPKLLQGRILVVSYLPFPVSYTERTKAGLRGMPNWGKPDADNIIKAILDALFEHDSFVYDERCIKLWDDGKGARSEVTLA